MSDHPLRIPDDPAMSPELRADFARARATADPPYDLAKGLAAFEAAIGAGALPASGSPAAAGHAASGTKALAGASAKLWLVKIGLAVAVGVAAVGSYLAVRTPRAPEQSAGRASHSGDRPVTIPAAPSVATAPAPPPAITAPEPAPSAPSAPAPTAPASPARRPPRAHAEAPPPRLELILAETRLLARERNALFHDNAPAEALALAAQGEAEFGHGILHEEREAIAIQALVRLGRTAEAAQRARRFLRRYPSGPISARVRQATGEGAPPDAGR